MAIEPIHQFQVENRKDALIGASLRTIYRLLYDHFGPQDWWPGDTPFEVAIGAILTQNTNWKNVETAIENLKAKDLLSTQGIDSLTHEELCHLIRPSGYFRVKAKRLKNYINHIVNHYDGDFEKSLLGKISIKRQELTGINGIGPETADSILLYAAEKPIFVIDTYTKRVLMRHGLIGDNVTYDEVQSLIMENLSVEKPEEKVSLYNEYHALFVALGKNYCRPKNPVCDKCPLSELL